MNKILSIITLNYRLTFKKIITAVVATVLLEGIMVYFLGKDLIYYKSDAAYIGVSTDELINASGLEYICYIAMIIVILILILHYDKNKKSQHRYMMERLEINYKEIAIGNIIYNTAMIIIFAAFQIMFFIGLTLVIIKINFPDNNLWMELIATSYSSDNEMLHKLLPLSDYPLMGQNIGGILLMGIASGILNAPLPKGNAVFATLATTFSFSFMIASHQTILLVFYIGLSLALIYFYLIRGVHYEEF